MRREGHAPPLQWRVQSPRVPGNLQLPMAVTARKGHAASVRRQSRQRLRSDRRYRRNRLVRFYRHLVRTGSAFPRLPRPLWGLAMTRQGSAAMGTVRHTESAVLLPLRGRAGHAPPLQGQCGLNGGWYKSAVPSRDCHVASLLAMTRQGSAAMGTVRRTESAVLLPLRGRAWLSPPLQGQYGLNDGRRMIHSSFFSIHYSLFHPSPCGGWQTI